MAKEEVLIDSGATRNFISKKLAKCLHLPLQELPQKCPIRNVDGTTNKGGSLTHYLDLLIQQSGQEHTLCFYVMELGQDQMLLSFPRFATFNLPIDWTKGTLDGLPIHVLTPKAATQKMVPAQRPGGQGRRPLP